MKLLARIVFWITGWKVTGGWPEGVEKAVLIAIPHTSNWDLLFARAAFYIMEVPSRVFFWEAAGIFLFARLSASLAALGASAGITRIKPSEVLRYQ